MRWSSDRSGLPELHENKASASERRHQPEGDAVRFMAMMFLDGAGGVALGHDLRTGERNTSAAELNFGLYS